MTLQEKRFTMLNLVEQWQQSGLSQAEFASIRDGNAMGSYTRIAIEEIVNGS